MSLDTTSLAISPPLRRMLAVALLLVPVVLLVTGLVLPTIERYDTLESGIADSALALGRFETAAARLPLLESQQKSLQQALATQNGFLKATNDALMAAEMQARIKSVVDRSGGQLKSTQILPARDENGFRKVTARVEVLGSTETLRQVWYEMEAGVPFLFIDNFEIDSRAQPRRDRTAAPQIMLDVRFELSAYGRVATP